MKLAICTTTINPPTEALKKFAQIAEQNEWRLFIAGDLKTPHDEYYRLMDAHPMAVQYITPEQQEQDYPELSKAIGWRCIQRRNFAFIYAYKWGAEVIASVDDDNIPYEGWGKNFVNKEVDVEVFEPSNGKVFDPLSVTTNPDLWHRGFPIQLLENKNHFRNLGSKKMIPLVQADLWDGDPDVDAICRIVKSPEVKFEGHWRPYTSNAIMPFNSQNTFISCNMFPTYFLFPGIGRMDDIFAAYKVQQVFPDSVIFNSASVYQKRNKHNLAVDLENELIGYKYALEAATGDVEDFLPPEAKKAYELYKKCF